MRLWNATLLVSLLWSGPARALSCDEVMLMVLCKMMGTLPGMKKK